MAFFNRKKQTTKEVWPDSFKDIVKDLESIRGHIFHPDEEFNPSVIFECKKYLSAIAESHFNISINKGEPLDRIIDKMVDVLLHEMIDVLVISEFYKVSKEAIIEEAEKEFDNPEAIPVRDEVLRMLDEMREKVMESKGKRGDFIFNFDNYKDSLSQELATVYSGAIESTLYKPVTKEEKEYIKITIGIVFSSFCKLYVDFVRERMLRTIRSLKDIVGEINFINDVADKKIMYNQKRIEL